MVMGIFRHLALSLTLTLSFFLGGCGKQLSSPTKVLFSLPQKAAGDLTGGVVIYGIGPNGARFGIGLQQRLDSRFLELLNGGWKFLAIGWEGPNKLQGTARCGIVEKNLIGGATQVEFLLTPFQCTAPEFSASGEARNGDQFAALRVVSCSHLGTVDGATSYCNYPLDTIGSGRSFQVIMMEYGGGRGIVPGLTSLCFNNPNYQNTSQLDFTGINIPLGGAHSELFVTKIISFGESDCGSRDNKREFLFPNGLMGQGKITSFFQTLPVDLSLRRFFITVSSKQTLNLYLADNDFGAAGTPFYDQWPSIECSGANCFPNGAAGGGLNELAKAGKGAFWDVVGTTDGIFPSSGGGSGQGGRHWGQIGEIRGSLGGDGLGGYLYSQGITSCSSIPTSGERSVTAPSLSKTYRIVFSSGSKLIPTGYTGAGSTFEKRITIYENSVINELMEFNCSTNFKAGWTRGRWTDDKVGSSNYGEVRNREVYYDTNTVTTTKVEFYDYAIMPGDTKKDYRAVKFARTGTNLFEAFKTTARFATSTWSSQRIGIKADSTKGNIFFQSVSNDTDTTTDYSASGTLACVNMSSHSSDTSCSTISAPGTPIVDGSGNFSIEWVSSKNCPGTNGLSCKLSTL